MDVDLVSDRALLDAFRRGDRDALERVYRAHVADVVALLRRGFVSGEARVAGVGDLDRALDLSQEVFLRAFSEGGRSSYDGLRPYRPFLLRIAKNLVIDGLRKAGREVPLSVAAGDDAPDAEDRLAPAPAPEPEADLDRQRLQQVTRAYVATLDAELARFVTLRFVEEGSQYEVLEAMQVSRRRVRTLERRALDGLRAYLAARGLP